jgi:hypothetical protein
MSSTHEGVDSPPGFLDALAHPLLDALSERRSRRMGLGMSAEIGPAPYASPFRAIPLDPLEQALLVGAAVGVTGPALGDLIHPDGMAALVHWSGRSFPSACNNQGTVLIATDDESTWLVDHVHLAADAGAAEAPRSPHEAADALLARDRAARIPLIEGRAPLPTGPPGLFGFNAWNVNQPGTTLFIPITDMTAEYLNVLLVYLGPESPVTLVDGARGGQAAGLEPWVRSGRLDGSRTMDIVAFEQRLLGIKAAEGAMVCQNVALVQQCLGLGGFTFSAYQSRWVLGGADVPGLGFRFAEDRAGTPVPLGLDGLIEGYTPPYHHSMDAAVDAFLAAKRAARQAEAPAMRDRADVLAAVPEPDDETVAMVKAYCGYVQAEYGRFPAHLDPMYMRLACQSHHLDPDFYDAHYPEGALAHAHRDHFRRWHPDLAGPDGRPPTASRRQP